MPSKVALGAKKQYFYKKPNSRPPLSPSQDVDDCASYITHIYFAT